MSDKTEVQEKQVKESKLLQNTIQDNKPFKRKSMLELSKSGVRARERKKKRENWLQNYIISHGNKTKANKLSGITPMTLSRWQQDPKFKAKVDETKQYIIDNAEEILFKRGKERSDTALIEWLRANSSKYSKKPTNSIQINNIVPILNGDTKKNIIDGINSKVVEAK